MSSPSEILSKYWGYDSFRPLQEDIVSSIIAKQDTVAILPTGGGKSICFQVPAMVQEGLCIVISPLIALIKDQVYQLRKRDIPAASIVSGMTSYEIDKVFQEAIQGKLKFLYCAPERLASDAFKQRLRDIKVNLVAIDESHCISQWGYDFRPSYLKIAELKPFLPKVPFVALTASATPKVKADIVQKLELKNPQIFQQSVARHNIAYVAIHADNKADRLLYALKKTKGTCLVYVRNRRQTQEIASFLKSHGLSADFYHAGLGMHERSKKQEAWIQGQTQTIVCTNAFGMGIDKADVRLVAHIDLPESVEAYYQEAGRAGRDGKPSYALLFHNAQDAQKLKENVEWAFPTYEVMEEVYFKLNQYLQIPMHSGEGLQFEFDIQVFSERFKVHKLTVFHTLKILEYNGLLKLNEAIQLPSTVQVHINFADFAQQNKSQVLDDVMQVMVRLYSGLQSYPVRISEKQIAQKLNIPNQKVIDALLNMHKQQWINYQPVSDKPSITFLTNRLDKVVPHINQALLKERKTDAEIKLKAMLNLVQKPECRSIQIQTYFGELGAKPCKTCDVCTEWLKGSLNNQSLISIYQKMVQLGKSLSNQEVKDLFTGFTLEQQQKALTLLQNEGFILYSNSEWQVL